MPHFWQKKLIEDYLETSGVPFVSLRPGALLGGGGGRFFGQALRRGRMMKFGSGTVPRTYIHIDEVARFLALAVDEPRAVGRRIDLGSDRAVSQQELAAVFSRVLGHEVRLRAMPAGMRLVFALAGVFSERARDMRSMGRYFETGKYVANTSVQAELFGPVPKVEDAARRMVAELGLVPASGL